MTTRNREEANVRHKKRVSVFGAGESQITFHFPEQPSWRYKFDYQRVDIEKRTTKGKQPIYKIDVYK